MEMKLRVKNAENEDSNLLQQIRAEVWKTDATFKINFMQDAPLEEDIEEDLNE